LLRQYFPKGTDLSVYSQRHLTRVAEELNNRPRKSLGFRTPAKVMAQQIRQLNSGVALQI
ncbi:IS30 family transposase, partial [Acidithiobacillus ferrooxidans]|nr:IS30 family transposase [Acidithiobacillus ferrooxidans]